MPETRTFAIRERDDATLGADARRAGVALSASELRRVAEGLGRDPTLVELYAFDAQWSEHCSYKSSRAFLSRLPVSGPDVIVGVGEDAGIVRLGEWEGATYGVVVAHESHNHPSQLVPFEGAATGIGGIVRDVLCMGARVIGIADPLRFGTYDEPHARYVAQGVVDGIAAYGNAIGVPNMGGDVYFHPGFDDNALVNVVALGVVDAAEIIHSAAPPESDGWDIVLVGKATDRSGFGGAAFSSLVLDEADREQNRSAVQVPDPFLKNVVMRASYRVFDEIRARGITVGFKDLGAGGIMGCTAELVASGGKGAIVDLERCPTTSELPSEVIAIGETQERLAWVVPPSFTAELLRIYNDEYTLPQIARGACAAVIGRVTNEERYVMRRDGETVMDVATSFLTSGIRYERPYELPAVSPETVEPGAIEAAPPTHELLAGVLAHRDVCSRETIFERYDSVVRGTTAIPAGYADAGVLLPVPGAPFGVALGIGGNPRYGALDPMLAAEHAVCEAVRNVVAVGARPAALTDCLNFGNPEDPRQMGEFVAAVDGLARAANALGLPYISGNVSLYNQSARGHAIPASPIVACVGVVDDVSATATSRFKRAGSPLYLLGAPQYALGGSVLAELTGYGGTSLPSIDYAALRAEIALLRAAFAAKIVLAAHDISDGGALAALAEMAFPTLDDEPIGAAVPSPGSAERFSGATAHGLGEWGGFIVEIADDDAFVRLAGEAGAIPIPFGNTTGEATLTYHPAGGARYDLHALRESWRAPLRDLYLDAVA